MTDSPKEKTMSDDLNEIIGGKEYEGTHFNFEPSVEYVISTGSLGLDVVLGGGLPNGISRFTGNSEAGKTSAALEVAKNFQLQFPENGFVFYCKAEGRLSKGMVRRSHLNTSPEKFFIWRSNQYEPTLSIIERTIKKYWNRKRLLFIIDSINSLVPQEALAKTLEDKQKTMGAAALNSMAMARLGSPITELGHSLIIVSQVREMPKMSMYETDKRRDHSNASGGNALIHAPNVHLQFEKRNKADYFKEEDNKPLEAFANEGLGHSVKITVIKSGNEKTLQRLDYPIRYNAGDKSSIWRELEVFKFAQRFGLFGKKKGWIDFSDGLRVKLAEKAMYLPEKPQREKAVIKFLEEHDEITDVIYNMITEKFKDL